MKDTLKELVMLPLQRPELFCKGQLTKVNVLINISFFVGHLVILEKLTDIWPWIFCFHVFFFPLLYAL